jgi:anti-sigma regulatory factor (Ser/Thr protein kinase)
MGLFGALGVDYQPKRKVHEEAGRFIPLRRIDRGADVQAFLADVAPLLHRPEHIQAVQYCLSELIRNVLEHAGGTPAFACAQYYHDAGRVSIGVADCGIGLRASLSRAHQIATESDAIIESLRPGVTGALPQLYGPPDNAGVGLFFTKSIAKASGEYFAIFSGRSAYRLRRRRSREAFRLFADPRRDRHDLYQGLPEWRGTVVAVNIRVHQARSFEATMAAIRDAISAERPAKRLPRVKFT